MKTRNKWREWLFEAKQTSVNKRIKRKTNKAERRYWKNFIQKEIREFIE